jgi:hypothetical protein
LLFLATRNYLEARFFERVSLCPKCSSHHLNVREICPGCRSSHLTAEGLLHHFRCGYVGLPSEFVFSEDGSYLCPKCKRKMYHLGTEYDRLGKAFVCRSCARISDNPPVEAVCLACGQTTLAGDLVSTEVYSYVLTSRGFAAARRGSLFDCDDLSGSDSGGSVSIAGAPVYRRAVTLEFLEQELKRVKHFDRSFAVLLVECAPAALHQPGKNSTAHWLGEMRKHLREIDYIGQMAEALFVAVLPRTRHHQAESLRQSVVSKLGPNSPLTLTSMEITKPEDLAAILVRREQGEE